MLPRVARGAHVGRSRSPNGLRARAELALTRTCDRGFVWAPSAAWNLQQGEVAWLSQQLKSALIYVFER